MPVLVTGATGMVGRALVRRLVADGGEVRAYVRREDTGLRESGAFLSIGPADNVQRIEAAATGAHTLVHLVGGLLPEGVTVDWLNRETTEVAVIAARAADVRRIVFLSFVGADPAARSEFLAAKGRAEEHVRDSGLEHAIFRCAPILGPGCEAIRLLGSGRLARVPGNGRQRTNPVALADVVAAIVAADGRGSEVRGTWDLGGPETMTVDDLAARLAPGRPRVHRVGVSRDVGAVWGHDMVAGTDASTRFEFPLTRVDGEFGSTLEL